MWFLFAALLGGCSIKHIAVNAFADELSQGSTFTRDDDLQFVGEAIPFGLKLMESLLAEVPQHQGLHIALASGFTQYAVVYVEFPAEQLRNHDYDGAATQFARARRLELRARDYALGALDLRHPGISKRLLDDPAALDQTDIDDVPALYWAGAAWMLAISNAREDPELLGQLSVAAGLLHRALDLDETWQQGAIHEALISVEPALPLPGGAQHAEEHFERAIELNNGSLASTYVSLATAVCVPAQDRVRFQDLLGQALALDPDADPANQLANHYAQERARYLLARTDDLILEDAP